MMQRLKRILTPVVWRWLVVGVIFAGASLILLKVMVGMMAWPFALATLVSSEICTLLRFLLVDRWVFGHPRPTLKRLWQYHIANVFGFTVWWSAANLLKYEGVNYLVSAGLASGFSVGVSIASNFLWIWRKPANARR